MPLEISKDKKTAILLGASGLVGSHCLDLLLASPIYDRVLSIGRRELEISNEKLVQHVIDFDKVDQYAGLFRGDDLFCCLGTTMRKAGSKEAFQKVDYHYIYDTARQAAKTGVNQFLLVSSVGASADSLFFYSRVKGKTEQAIRELPFWAVHIFRPSLLLGERNENRWGEEIAEKIGKGLDLITGGLLTKYKPVEAEVVAKAMVQAAQGLQQGIHFYPSHLLQQLAAKEDRALKNI